MDLPTGITIYLLMKDGIPHLPNPELGKILPAVNRAAMEHFRKAYGITVTQVREGGREGGGGRGGEGGREGGREEVGRERVGVGRERVGVGRVGREGVGRERVGGGR